MTVRVEIESIKQGQERDYGDTISHMRITFTHQSPYSPILPPPWLPAPSFDEARVRAILLALPCGFIETTSAQRGHGLDSYLDWLRETAPSVWEWRVVTPWND